MRTIDITDAGADPDGETEIDPVVRNRAAPNTRLVFPPGRYLVGSLGELTADRLELVAPEGATLVPRDRTAPERLVTLAGREQRLEGFDYEVEDCRVAPAVHVRSDATIRNFAVRGPAGVSPHYEPSDQGRDAVSMFNVKDVPAGSTFLAESIYMGDGVGRKRDARRGWYLSGNDGTVELRDVTLAGWAENTVYGTYANGQDANARSIYRNVTCQNTNIGIRTSGDTLVEDSVFVRDGSVPAQGWSGARRQRGIWIEGGKSAHPDGTTTIRNCEFLWESTAADQSGQPLVCYPPPRRIELSGLRINNQHPSWPTFELDPHDRRPVELVVEDVHVTQRNNRPVFRLRGDHDIVRARNLHVDADGPLSDTRSSQLARAVESHDPDPTLTE
ncbi:hypothetical protein [Haloarchaeobius amylolyticus]|uniref:hypothetical protein n=1 Tax=Haloarchaeobius amylolyticus TaxID=1198296 RepID=UPI00227011BB|nr:hypothetical protein [Haloarchaeobius amylolyticus]